MVLNLVIYNLLRSIALILKNLLINIIFDNLDLLVVDTEGYDEILITNFIQNTNIRPLIILEWGKVTVKWWSHKINGLHKNDFICAAKTDLLLN